MKTATDRWNEGVVEETVRTFEAPLKESCADPAAIDKTVNVYYDQSVSAGGEHKLIRVDSIADNVRTRNMAAFMIRSTRMIRRKPGLAVDKDG